MQCVYLAEDHEQHTYYFTDVRELDIYDKIAGDETYMAENRGNTVVVNCLTLQL